MPDRETRYYGQRSTPSHERWNFWGFALRGWLFWQKESIRALGWTDPESQCARFITGEPESDPLKDCILEESDDFGEETMEGKEEEEGGELLSSEERCWCGRRVKRRRKRMMSPCLGTRPRLKKAPRSNIALKPTREACYRSLPA
ncbi:hypothetical protein QBC36DRAFT_293223 [Triangularia setosa]|uniref:Uncharacterized protein n=1 Tax=Triangularia setosa TaxID=2587417 RepID=A0AAN7A4D9_9PEZI|nr:hypothetical protein QBC36DRAFT_293223 [Podospora setosa]